MRESLVLFCILTPALVRASPDGIQTRFRADVQPLLATYCRRCHNAEKKKSGVRVDRFDGALEGRHPALWKRIREQVSEENMPPDDEPQPTANERRVLTEWITDALAFTASRKRDKNGSLRRLTVVQYRNTLRDLLGLEDDLTDVLPRDAVSRDGFTNSATTLELSPLLVEAYFEVAEKALERCIVVDGTKPVIQCFRVDLGDGINPRPCPDKLILGANSRLLPNDDFVVVQPSLEKPFDFEPLLMRAKWRFIEGYQGNDTVRGWREYDSIYHAVFAGMRGTDGYPKGLAHESVPEGLLLRLAIPSAEIFEVESTYGPRANFKISARELPDHGRFRVTVTAARYDDGLLLDAGASARDVADGAISIPDLSEARTVDLACDAVYQIDVFVEAAPAGKLLSLDLGRRHFSGALRQPAFLVARLPEGALEVSSRYDGKAIASRIILTPLDPADKLAKRFEVFETRVPRLGVHVGLRRDCGSTLDPVGAPRSVPSTQLANFVFEGAIDDFPSPDVEKDNANYLAGIREIAVRSEYTDGRDMPRLLVRSVRFEGPFHETWPPETHRRIFIESENTTDPAAYAREIIRSFATRAFRRPVFADDLDALFALWKEAYEESGDFRRSVADALVVVLTSPRFLFLIESSASPEAEPLDPWELASKLSYFFWNTMPDGRLLELAAAGGLHDSLDGEVDRMIADPRFERFAQEFVSQWLRLDKLDVVAIDRERYPKLTRDTRAELREEPVRFLLHLLRENLPLRNLIESDFIVANEVVASYYGVGARTESGFDFVPIAHGDDHLGGLLSQAGILAGLSNGRESNPVKRGAWLARKIIAEPPDDPPPNVPALPDDDDEHLTLRQKLERHRDQEGCANCHGGIDPWGLPLEQFDAGGLFKIGTAVDARSTLPDGTEIADANALKAYLVGKRLDRVVFSFLNHLATYATGRELDHQELEFLERESRRLESDGYRAGDMIRFVVTSPLFLEK